MVPESVVTSANICQSVAIVIALTAYLPQWLKILRTQSSESISLRSWGLWLICTILGLYYATVQLLLNGNGWALVASSSIALVSVSLTIWLILRYRPERVAMRQAKSESSP